MPQNFTPYIANGESFIPYQLGFLPPVNGNVATHPWVIPPHLSPLVSDLDNNEAPLNQPQQNVVPMTGETPFGIESEYRGPAINFNIPSQLVQPSTQHPLLGAQPTHPEVPPAHPGPSYANDGPQYVISGAQYAPYVNPRVQYTNIGPQYSHPGIPYALYVNSGEQYSQVTNLGAQFAT